MANLKLFKIFETDLQMLAKIADLLGCEKRELITE